MSKLLRAASGEQVEMDSNSGPSSYPSGGFSQRTDLGRVDEAMVEVDKGSYQAHVESINDSNALVIEVHSQGSGEVAAGTDLSAESFTTHAQRL